ncbi:MAG: hypothetical protein IPK15_13755 [Verrucomicrobia bacterium]|nr:hypothetical protein [Verrucomicrobiota bacterium]
MNDDELKQLWQRQPLRAPDVSPEQLMSAMQTQTSQLRRTLVARDLRELVACALVVIIFGSFISQCISTPVSRVGDLIVIGGAIFIAWKLIHTRRTTPPAPPGATVVESLRAELKAVRAQSRLLGSVLWWYLLPPFVGVTVATWGLQIDPFTKIFCTLFFIAVNASIYWLNQWARSKQLLPLEAQLESLIHAAETGEPPDETRIANLRPLVLSMAAADRVKPVEFKIAFSQIAIYGVSGFVGTWFFLMLGLTMSSDSWKTYTPAVQAPVPGVPNKETDRYSGVARTVVDLFNARDYTAVQKLYNAEMSQAFPPKETSDFYTGIAAKFGGIQNIEGPIGDGLRWWTTFLLHCQRGHLIMSLVLDADDKISGIRFNAAPRPSWNFKAFILHLFRWQHLLWLVPFVLGGWVYCWLLQKTTERAVGISTLGIHLHKGLNLILWGDIKEVRLFRLLNIRSLWLIQESGEKTIMPWTGLERPADLKAAVEQSAPANHPIRKHLSLLRRA